MAKQQKKTTDIEEAKKKFPHLKEYMDELDKKNIKPKIIEEVEREMQDEKPYNHLYPVGDPIFVHVYSNYEEGITEYNVVEPRLAKDEEELYKKIVDKLVDLAYKEPVPNKANEIGPILVKLLDDTIKIGEGSKGVDEYLNPKISVTQRQYNKIKHFLLRDRVGYGKLESLFHDPNLEDIHCTGTGQVTTQHKVFGMVHTNIWFRDDQELNQYIIEVTERVERPASDADSVVDAMMPDGSRANFIYGREVSLEGSSFTIRKFSEVPISITQIINFGTMSAEMAGYLWLALENGMNLFVCGETASGKTTTLNAISTFIKPDAKVYTVENTPEVTMPHDVWQHLVTREAGRESDVTYQDLLIAALRSRPDYIIVGEIRGEEGNIAFQAMQTGHPVMSTFHSGDVDTMVQRITGHPINVPITFIDNLNLSLIQQAVERNGKMIRRCLSLTEIERYYEPEDAVVKRQVFDWNPADDKHVFRGMFNSYILEQKIAKIKGYTDPRAIYTEMKERKRILEKMVEEKIFDYFEVFELIKKYNTGGKEALPFKI